MTNYSLNPQVSQIIERITDEYNEDFGSLEDTIKRASMLKFRDILYETVLEYNRSGEFVRIFPCKGSKPYEKFFSGVFGTRMLNRLVHKALFTSDVMMYDKTTKLRNEGEKRKYADPKSLKYDI